MLRAEAAVFEPQAQPGKTENARSKLAEDVSDQCTYFEDLCPTAVPSPALTAVSSGWSSPLWSCKEFGWEAPSSPMMWIHDAGEFDQFVLPEAVEFDEAGEVSDAVSEEQEFRLAGVQDLQASLSKLLTPQLPEKADASPTEAPAVAPQWFPPPGLDLPPGLELLAVDETNRARVKSLTAPPGFDEAEISKQGNVDNSACNAKLSSGCTTVMLRNIPNKYSRERLIAQLHENGFKGDIDFLYLPIDFKNLCNVGYAFLNFRTPEACHRFAKEYHNVASSDILPGFKSKKVCEVAEATCQGCERNVARLHKSPVMAQLLAKREWLPLLFDETGEAVEFPVAASEQQASTRSSKMHSAPRRSWA